MSPRDALAAAFPWPRPPGANNPPTWLTGGRGFDVDGAMTPLLSFMTGSSGWTDDLTALHEAESSADHPIDVASRARALETVEANVPRGGVVLEVGCSSGYFLKDLRAALPSALIIGADYVAGPLQKLAASSDLPILQLDLRSCPLPDASVDAVVALNVLEHIDDDAAAVAQVFRILKPGGVAVIELPAGPHLYDVYDKALMHFRRYTVKGAVSLFERAGFRVDPPTHIGALVYPGFALVKIRNKRHMSKSASEQQKIVTQKIRATKSSPAIRAAFALERAIGRFVRYPFGIRVVLTARKPS